MITILFLTLIIFTENYTYFFIGGLYILTIETYLYYRYKK